MKTHSLRERLRESTSATILDAAEAVAAAEGMAGASLQAIAQEAGIAVGTIYNYFHDRQELFDELFSRRREELFRAIEAAAKSNSGRSFEEQLESFVRAVFAHFDARRAFLRMALEADRSRSAILKGGDGKSRPAMEQLQAHADRIIRLGVREKRVREERSHLFSTALVSILRGVLVARADHDGPLAEETPGVVELFLHGVGR